MARQPRLVVPDIALHIVQRGVDRKDCFREDTDRLVYLTLLRDFSAATGCSIHAYCLMTNHVHLLLTPTDASGPATLMYRIGQRYVPYFNRRYGRTGTLWEGRFKSCLVDSARYVLGCYRYIELNPIEAGMVAAPASYPWSSYCGNAGIVETSSSAHTQNMPRSDAILRPAMRRTAASSSRQSTRTFSRRFAPRRSVATRSWTTSSRHIWPFRPRDPCNPVSRAVVPLPHRNGIQSRMILGCEGNSGPGPDLNPVLAPN